MNAHRYAQNAIQPDTGADADTTGPDRETVEVTYYPVLKNRALGRRMTRRFAARRGEHPYKAAERELARRYKVRDYVIFEAHLAQVGFLDRSEI